MKVALCLSGQVRSFDRCFSSLKERIIDRYHPDIYCYFWHGDNFLNAPTQQKWYGVTLDVTNMNVPQNAMHVLETLKPLKYIIRSQISFEDIFYQLQCNTGNSRMQAKSFQNVLSMYHAIAECNRLCKNSNIEYDVVIRARTDIVYNNDMNLMWDESLHVPNKESYGGCCDWFAYGNPKNINIYSSCNANISNLFAKGVNFHPESLLKAHLLENATHIEYNNMDIELCRT